jgi:hypothetical protein
MEPGFRLDRTISEKIMGIGVMLREGDGLYGAKPGFSQYTNEPKPYSTSIEAAWEVVEQIKSLQPDPDKDTRGQRQEFRINFDQGKWTCGWYPYSWDGVPTVEAEADTAPLAISLAALKAVGEK